MKFINLLILIFFVSFKIWGQCPTADIFLTTQGKVDSFAIHYPGCTEVLGSLKIGGFNPNAQITNLNGLQQITSIGGNLNLWGNASLTNCQGLNSLTTIGGNFWVYTNDALMSFEGLSSLQKIGGYLDVELNSSLTTFQGLNTLDSVGGYLEVHKNNALVSLHGLNELSKIKGDLNLNDNPSLANLHALGFAQDHWWQFTPEFEYFIKYLARIECAYYY